MRKTIVFILFLCLQMTAWAQTTYRYWFDTDDGSAQEGVSGENRWQMDIDVSDLTENIHQLHLQVADKGGTWSTIRSHWFIKAPISASHGVYWFDESIDDMQRSDVLNGRFNIDVSQLTDGIHMLTYQVRDKKDRPSAQYRTIFLKTPVPAKSKIHYWIDEDSETMQTLAYNGNTHVLDLDGVSDGFHILHIQAEDASLSAPLTKLFIKIPQTEGVESLTCLCSIDGETVKQEAVANHNGVLNWMLDVTDITQGIHHIQVQVVTKSGAGSSLYEGFFLRDFTSVEIASLKCVYSIDGDPHRTMAGSQMGGGLFHFDLDVADIKAGLHNITYMLVGDNGVCTKSNSAFFWKTPLGGNGVTQYNYWLNEQAEKHEVVLAKRTNPFNLITLLPVEKMPVRSYCFDFKVENGAPVLYAKNDIHFEFIDASGFVLTANSQYVDPNTKQKVGSISNLKATQTFARPAENGFKWFKFLAAPGDTISFRSSQATTMQVFSPSGKELYAASGDKSVLYGGCHTWEEGTHYLAVHDVTGSRSTLTLDYMHMDKYDVVSQDVHAVGNGGCSTITFQGNGFRDLYEVILYTEQGEEIHSLDIGHESDASTTATFDFTDVALGSYDALFRFTEEDKTFAECITVQEAKDIELSVKVSYPSRFWRGTATTYTVEITNKGNMTAYFVPTEFRLSTNQFASISSVFFKDSNGKRLDNWLFNYTEADSIDAEVLEEFREMLNEITDLSSFMIVTDSVNNCEVGFTDRYITVPPSSTTIYLVEMKSTESISLHVSIPSKWFAHSSNAISTNKRKAVKKDLCCEKEKWECISNNLADALGLIAPPGLGCALSVGDLGTNAMFEIMCANGNSPVEKLKTALSNKSSSLAQKAFWAVLDCISFGITKKIGKLKNTRKQLEQTRKFELDRSIENHNLYHKFIQEYDNLMYKAEDLYKEGKIAEAEKIENEAKTVKHDADMLKIEEEKSAENAKQLKNQIDELNKDIDQEKLNFAQIIDKLKTGIKIALDNITCSQERLDAKKKCNDDNDDDGGDSNAVNSLDPNDVYGYIGESGSKFANLDVLTVPYRIEFENDTTFATASAHTVIVKDTLDATLFDLSSYRPTSIKIGENNVSLKGDKQFVTTVDMRPAINAIAQVDGSYDEQKGIATWQFTSLDPMTMEPTNDVMQGFLPINYDGISGIGEVAFDIALRQPLADGTEIHNRASIVFDKNDAILTPTWTNTIDAISPEGSVIDVTQHGDSTFIVCDGSDERSGIWKYEVYAQPGVGASWLKVGECYADSAMIAYEVFDGIDYGFCALAVDSAGNVEQKELLREISLMPFSLGDVKETNT